MKNTLLLIGLIGLFLIGCTPKKATTSTPTKGIHFIEGISYKAVLEKAATEGKPIMIDFYTTWCAPCKWLEEDVFYLENVSKYYNRNFVNLKVNAENFDGIELAQQFEVTGYPTIIFLTQNGEIVHTHTGTTTASNFMKMGKETYQQNQGGISMAK